MPLSYPFCVYVCILFQSDLEEATKYIKYAVKACIKKRRKAKFSDNFSKSTAKAKSTFYASYTDGKKSQSLCSLVSYSQESWTW